MDKSLFTDFETSEVQLKVVSTQNSPYIEGTPTPTGLEPGYIVLIVLVCLVAVAIIVVGTYYYIRRNKNKPKKKLM